MREERGKVRRERGEEDMMREKDWYETIKAEKEETEQKDYSGVPLGAITIVIWPEFVLGCVGICVQDG